MYDWVYLVFLPAGTKLICILLFGIWGSIGDAIALFFVTLHIRPNVSTTDALIYAVAGSLITLLSIKFLLHLFKVKTNLSNLKYWHIPSISLLTSVLHAVIFNIVFSELQSGKTYDDQYLVRSVAMAFGDFTGIALIILLLIFAISKSKLLRLFIANIQTKIGA